MTLIDFIGNPAKNHAKLEKYIISDFMTYSAKDPKQEELATISIVFMYNLIVQGCITDEEVLCEVIPQLESRLMYFLNLRYSEDEASKYFVCLIEPL
jgi:hypothetical protein